MHHGIATAIASDFLNRRRNRKEFPQREANLAIFIAKCIARTSVSLPQRNRNLFPRKNRCVQFDRVNESQTSTANHRRETVHLGVNCRKLGFPAERCMFLKEMCTFLQKNALSCRKMRFPADKCNFLQKNAFLLGGGHMAGKRRKLQEGCRAQASRALANFHKNLNN